METKQIEFTSGEAQTLLQLLDIATRTEGLRVAEAALALSKKIEAPFNNPQEDVPEKDDK